MTVEIQLPGQCLSVSKVTLADYERLQANLYDPEFTFVEVAGFNKSNGMTMTLHVAKQAIVFVHSFDDSQVGIALPPSGMLKQH